mmetsp:Transcript_50303/g.75155  ORF Transcript_50303/g.75155 Transcript_50303/m.75155 type:complete len:83 (+) Transcript_50303:726-974(+)
MTFEFDEIARGRQLQQSIPVEGEPSPIHKITVIECSWGLTPWPLVPLSMTANHFLWRKEIFEQRCDWLPQEMRQTESERRPL